MTFDISTPLGPDNEGKARKPLVRTGTGLNKPEGKLDVPCDGKWVNLAGNKPVVVAGTAAQLGRTTVTGWINWLVEVDGGTLVDPDDDLVAQSADTALVLSAVAFKGTSDSEIGATVSHVQQLWNGKDKGDPVLDIQYTFKRIR